MAKTVWVLTREINQYDQDGEYFVDVFAEKPTRDQIQGLCDIVNNEDYISHVMNGGGRKEREDEWWNLREHSLS